MNTKTREVWLDNIKLFACILVVLGHFFQSMTKSGIIPADGWHMWFDRAVYLFHVQLFFVCSGYLYQKYTVITSVRAWVKNIWKKVLLLGVPYFFFSLLSWGGKYLLASSVNSVEADLIRVLFFKPMAPYWYMYTLFLIFVCVPIVRTQRGYGLVVLVALSMKSLHVCEMRFPNYTLEVLCSNTIWFVLGMGVALINIKKIISSGKALIIGIILFVCFCAGSVYVYINGQRNRMLDLVFCIMACVAVLLIVGHIFADNHQNTILGFLSKYIMPIFLMHTIFAAGIRIVLLRLGIVSPMVHFILGIMGSFVGPIVTTMLLSRIPYGDFVIYPGKYLNGK